MIFWLLLKLNCWSYAFKNNNQIYLNIEEHQKIRKL